MSETRRFPPRPFPPPDWRNAKTYHPLLSLDRAAWAWQWLKRNPEFVASARQGRRRPRPLPGPHPAPRNGGDADAAAGPPLGCPVSRTRPRIWCSGRVPTRPSS
jgi:hypothetical protein